MRSFDILKCLKTFGQNPCLQSSLLLPTEYHKLMLVGECLSTLLFPFQWQHVYVPILPASMLHFLDAPVPFIMGLHLDDTMDQAQLEIPNQVKILCVQILRFVLMGIPSILYIQFCEVGTTSWMPRYHSSWACI